MKKFIELLTDQEFDAESGLYNYDARLYDPVIGRFISPDSVIPDQYNPQSLNRYSYCLNNPLVYNDPTGHTPAIEAFLVDFAAGFLNPGTPPPTFGGVTGGLVGYFGNYFGITPVFTEAVESAGNAIWDDLSNGSSYWFSAPGEHHDFEIVNSGSVMNIWYVYDNGELVYIANDYGEANLFRWTGNGSYDYIESKDGSGEYIMSPDIVVSGNSPDIPTPVVDNPTPEDMTPWSNSNPYDFIASPGALEFGLRDYYSGYAPPGTMGILMGAQAAGYMALQLQYEQYLQQTP